MFHALALFALTMNVAPDLEQRLRRYKPVEMTFAAEQFTARELRLINELIAAVSSAQNGCP